MWTTVTQSHGNIEKIAPQKLIIVTRGDDIEPKILSKVIASKSNWSKKHKGKSKSSQSSEQSPVPLVQDEVIEEILQLLLSSKKQASKKFTIVY